MTPATTCSETAGNAGSSGTTGPACRNPEHGDCGTACAGCARACEAELSALNDQYMRLLRERREWESDVKAASRRSGEDTLNTFGLWRIEHAMGHLAQPLREVAGRASMITPGKALAEHRGQVAEFQRAAELNLREFDQAHRAAAEEAARLWAAWRAENKQLRELIARAGRAMHDDAAPHDLPCRCDGCQLIRAMDRVPVTPESCGLPTGNDGPGSSSTTASTGRGQS